MAIRVLIADDHDVTRKGVRTILSHEGIEVCGEASNGIEAVTNAVDLRPDLVILDLTMPMMGGFEAARELLKRRSLARASRFLRTYHEPARFQPARARQSGRTEPAVARVATPVRARRQ